MKKISLEFEDIIGRYFNLKVKKHNYRIYAVSYTHLRAHET